jgi:hypothetical protein
MEDFKKHIKPFGIIKKTVEKDPMTPKYIKPDGTKVIEQETPDGLVVYEILPNHTVICRSYNKSGTLFLDWIRRRSLEIGHIYDECEQAIYEYDLVYDKNNTAIQKTEYGFKYHDNGVKAREFIIVTPSEIKTEILYNEKGERTSKIEYRGTVKTFFDKDDKPFKREIDRGSGGIITENL